MNLTFAFATTGDAVEIAALRNAAAAKLTETYGTGVWSTGSTERGVLRGLARPQFERTLIARKGRAIVAVLHLQTKKPWAIDIKYFTPVPKALYLVGMAVHPDFQRAGAGRAILKEAERVARSWREHTEIGAASGLRKKSSSSSIRENPVTAIRLDAWDATAGAGPFYAKCGYREVARVVYRGNPLIYYERLL